MPGGFPDRFMHVVIVADFANNSGGAPRVAIESARAMAELGARITYFHAVEGADAALDHPGIERRCLGLRDIWSRNPVSAAVNGVWSREAGAAMRAALAPFTGAKDTVLHSHQWTRSFSPAILPAYRASRLPIVVTAHEYFLACPNGLLFRFDRSEPCALKPMSFACVSANCDTRSYPHKLVRLARHSVTSMQWSADWPINVVHISDAARDRLAPLLPANFRHHRIDNPISVKKGPPTEMRAGAPFAYVGRLTVDKGSVLAARAAANSGAKIMFIGEGPAEAEIRSVLPDATITGWLDAASVENLLRGGVRAVVAPSQWPETGPLTVVEAAGMGVASIVSARCGASERVDSSTGIVVEPEVSAIAAAMRALADDDRARAMGRAAWDRFWADPPTPEAHARRLLTMYKGLLAA